MDQTEEILNLVKGSISKSLEEMVSRALDETSSEIADLAAASRPELPDIQKRKASILRNFGKEFGSNFDGLSGVKSNEASMLNYDSLLQVEGDDLEPVIAMEGMVAYARNCDIQEYLSFTTRLDSMFFNTRIDESNNPMDPEQIGHAFKTAIQPLGLSATESLIAFRKFNSNVFNNLEKIFEEANGILIDKGIMPELDIAARNRKALLNKRDLPRKNASTAERVFSATVGERSGGTKASSQLFSMMQNLMRGLTAQKASSTPLEEHSDSDSSIARDDCSSDITKLVTYLYEEIWQDETIPIPIKDIIGRTQLTILKIALSDTAFFDVESHPARVLLNQLATAGISWTEFKKLGKDPMYIKMGEIVSRLNSDFDGNLDLVEALVDEFAAFKRDLMRSNLNAEEGLEDLNERQDRLDEIKQYSLQKIEERILDEAIDPFVKAFLLTHFHGFVVQILLQEGPGGISWKPVMNTIDVLLWTVKGEKDENDFLLFQKINPRLLTNLAKALEIAGLDKAEVSDLLGKLERIQEKCFEESTADKSIKTEESNVAPGGSQPKTATADKLPSDDEHLLEVSKYPIGIWLEFQVEQDKAIRCTLAAKIDSIEKYVFVNAQGVKVIEKSLAGLARELKAGTVKVISKGPVIDRAMESVIRKLKDANLASD